MSSKQDQLAFQANQLSLSMIHWHTAKRANQNSWLVKSRSNSSSESPVRLSMPACSVSHSDYSDSHTVVTVMWPGSLQLWLYNRQSVCEIKFDHQLHQVPNFWVTAGQSNRILPIWRVKLRVKWKARLKNSSLAVFFCFYKLTHRNDKGLGVFLLQLRQTSKG